MGCLQDFKWHPIYETQSNLGCIAIINPISNTSLEEELIAIAKQPPVINFPEIPKECVVERKFQTPKRKLVFDESCVILSNKASKLSDKAALTFEKQRKIVNSELRDISTIPVISTMSYRNALVEHKPEVKQHTVVSDLKLHKAEFYKVKTLFFAWNKILFKKWQEAKIDKRYKNPFFSKTQSFLDRFYQEPTEDMKKALDEWYVLAATFGQVSGRIKNDWSK
jgi:hypothetical protein